ncbi:hypothetical protein BTN45_23540 [Rhizobium sp. ZX09]|nr:hypothetical protein BTN45_23540 [Rhizobium sp. ZX09]
MFCVWFRPRHNCKTGLRELLSVIHKDPVKLRVALLAADPPDNTATQPILFSRTEFARPVASTVKNHQCELFQTTVRSGSPTSVATCFRVSSSLSRLSRKR